MEVEIDGKMVNYEEHNGNLVSPELRIIGDKSVVRQVIKLLAYIRHAVNNNAEMEISVKTGRHVANQKFLFDVNGLAVQDLIAENEIEIS